MSPDDAGRRNLSAQDVQGRMLASLRERLGIENDDEWGVIAERVMKIAELRRATGTAASGAAAAMAMRGGGSGGADARGGRGFGARTPEMEAMQAAVTDKLPDAEIKARLAQVRETRKANEAKLEKAQEDLRSMLTLRQEAIAVLLGLLP